MTVQFVFECAFCSRQHIAEKYFPSSTDMLYHLPDGWMTSRLEGYGRVILCPHCYTIKEPAGVKNDTAL